MTDTTEATPEATEDDLHLIRKFNDDDGVPLVETTVQKAEPTTRITVNDGTVPAVDRVHRPRVVKVERDGMTYMQSEIGDGVFVGWDRCSQCSGNVATGCNCAGGPVEPNYVVRWRERRFDKSFERVPRHHKAKLHDSKALSFLEIAQIAQAKLAANPSLDLEELAVSLEQADRSVLRANLGLKPVPATPADPTPKENADA